MEYYYDNIKNFKIFVKTGLNSSFTKGYGFLHEDKDRTLKEIPQFDFYIPIFLTRSGKIIEYVNVDKDDTVFVINRQELNPYFIEFSFFDSIKRNKINEGSDLTSDMINFIKSVRPDIASLMYNDLKTWFNNIGKYEFPWNGNVDVYTLEKISLTNQNIISKAFVYEIEINK